MLWDWPEFFDELVLLDAEPESGRLTGTKADHLLILQPKNNKYLTRNLLMDSDEHCSGLLYPDPYPSYLKKKTAIMILRYFNFCKSTFHPCSYRKVIKMSSSTYVTKSLPIRSLFLTVGNRYDLKNPEAPDPGSVMSRSRCQKWLGSY